MSTRRWRALIAEDEDLARDRLVRLLRDREDFHVDMICANGDDAMHALETAEYDVALLDIQMPGATGMSILSAMQSVALPVVILVTAHAQFAIEAFAGQAADYLLKPFSKERFDQALDVARDRLESHEAQLLSNRISALVNKHGGEATIPHESRELRIKRLLVADNGHWQIVRLDHVDWIEATGRHCVLHLGIEQHCIRRPFSTLISQIQANDFVQVSRTVALNANRIRQLQEMFKGDLVAVLTDGTEVSISRRFRTPLLTRLDFLRTVKA